MKTVQHILILLSIGISLRCSGDLIPSSSLTTSKIITRNGYAVEEHCVQTADGYILTLHRIPFDNSTSSLKRVAFLMHGMLGASSDWVISGRDKALGLLLADQGYDVWLGNARGNTYSKKHTKYSHHAKRFWDFEWHDIALYDLPAMIEYVLYVTGESNVRYFGHSQGTTSFIVLNSLQPHFASRIKSAHLLAPVVYMHNMKSSLAPLSSIFLGNPNGLVEIVGSTEILPNNKLMEVLGYQLCRDNTLSQEICANAMFLLAGYNDENLNRTMIPDIMATTPAGASVNQLIHYLQEYNSKKFRPFDYGFVRNMVEYGKKKPDEYPVGRIKTPLFLYYSDNDLLASAVDVKVLAKALPTSTLKGKYRVPHKKWNHLDFVYGNNAKELVYDRIFSDMLSIS